VRAVVDDRLHLGACFNGDEMRVVVRHLTVLLRLDPTFRRVDELVARRRVSNVAHRTRICHRQRSAFMLRAVRSCGFWPTVLSVEPMVQCVVCRLSSVCRLSVCL